MSTTLELPSPVELGFPAKFGDWRPEQLEGIDRIVNAVRRFIGLGMPTGAGKSLTYVAGGVLHPGVARGLFLTSTKGLQDQNAGDFRDLGLLDVRGQRNYTCNALLPGGELDYLSRGHHLTPQGCDDGPCHAGVHCSQAPDRQNPAMEPKCLYYNAVWRARRQETTLVQTNYAYHMSSSLYGQGLGKFEYLVLDEAHEAMKELENFLTFTMTRDDADLLKTHLPNSEEPSDWKDWALAHISHAQDWYDQLPVPKEPSELRERRKFSHMLQKLEMLSDIDADDWVLETDEKGTRGTFSPLRVARYAEKYLFQGIPHVVLASATLTDKTFALLGVGKDDYSLWEAPSRFPVSRRPVIHVATNPSVRVDSRHNSDMHHAQWRIKMDNLLRPRMALGWKGIIHTVSYRRMKYLLQTSEFRKIMIAHDSDHTRIAVNKFKQQAGPALLVSPSVTTGWDFPDDDCRFQIIGKVPFPDMRGAIMESRKEMDPEWIPYLVVQTLVQAAGRGMRSAEDWCETLIIDDNIEWFWKKHKHMFPKWFVQAYQVTRMMPPPLEVDGDEEE